MIRRVAALILPLALGSAATPARAPAAPQPALLEPVPLVSCPKNDGSGDGYSGTAVRIGPHLLLSVKHVTSLPHCEIDGLGIRIIYQSTKADFTILSDDRAGKWLRIDCGGFVAGRTYIAIGHPRGIDSVVAVPLVATGEYEDGMATLDGVFTVQPGHSGGAIIDAETKQVVGLINAANWEEGTTFSVELKGTPICHGSLA